MRSFGRGRKEGPYMDVRGIGRDEWMDGCAVKDMM